MDFKQASQVVNKALRSMHLDQDTHDSLAMAFQVVMQGRPVPPVEEAIDAKIATEEVPEDIKSIVREEIAKAAPVIINAAKKKK